MDYNTSVHFKTSDFILQNIFDEAEKYAANNITEFGQYRVLVEGGGYNNVWLETQPMGGLMYAKRNLLAAKNNIEIFIDHQREDGRLPGMISNKENKLVPHYGWLQGFCFPMPAYELYYWLDKDIKYLLKLYNTLKNFDDYLWKNRDSDDDGCLETWCVWDTGEDGSIRFGNSPNSWSFDFPPTKNRIQQMTSQELKKYCDLDSFNDNDKFPVPIESMNIMSYSYSARDVLSLISKKLNNGEENYWRNKAKEVKKKIKDYLWVPEKHACYDRDNTNTTMDILSINNLMCMYFGSFDQDMADSFIKYHLLNPEEFWTPVPLPSIAVNDPAFRNIPGNNWSGQPEGLTFQRSIRALENYGHFAELTMLGNKYLIVIEESKKFVQQYDPFKKDLDDLESKEKHKNKDGYGPSILAALEFISRFYGIHLTRDKIYWSCLDSKYEYYYTQKRGNKVFELKTKGDKVFCHVDGNELFNFGKGIRLVSDVNGELIEIVGIDIQPKSIEIEYHNKTYNIVVQPNSIYRLNNKMEFSLFKLVEFYKEKKY